MVIHLGASALKKVRKDRIPVREPGRHKQEKLTGKGASPTNVKSCFVVALVLDTSALVLLTFVLGFVARAGMTSRQCGMAHLLSSLGSN